MRKSYRIALWGSAAVVVLAIGGAAIAVATFDPNRYKPQVAAAVKRATGRDLALNGPITLEWGLSPTFAVHDVALANIAGGSRPAMLALGELRARISLPGLLRNRLDIAQLVLVKPDILLETNSAGEPNWRFGPAVPSQPLPQPLPENASRAAPPELTLRDLLIEDGAIAYRAGGREQALALPRFEAKAASRDAPMEISLHAAYAGAPFTTDGTVGSLAAAQTPDPNVPWPVRLTLASGGAQATVAGTLREPLRGRGYDLTFEGSAPDLAALQPFVQAVRLPPLRAVTASAKAADAGGGKAALSALKLHAGASDFGALLAGLRLEALDVTAPGLGEPTRIAAKGALGEAPITFGATVLPSQGGIALQGLKLVLPQADLAGDLTIGAEPRPSVRGTLAATRIDADALAAAASHAPAAPAPAGTPPLPPTPAPPAASAPLAAPASRPPGAWVIPDVPLPLALLRRADADLAFKAGVLIARGTEFRDLAGHLLLDNGHLRLDPFAATLPGGQLHVTFVADASHPVPPVAVGLRAPRLQLASLLAAARLPAEASGTVDVDLDLKGAGQTPHAIASTATGHLGLASVDGKIGNRVLAETIGPILARANLPGIGAAQGLSDLRCLALRVDANGGQAVVRALLVDTTAAYLEGSGTLDLGAETLDLRLRPLVRLGGTGVAVPLRVGGTFRAPSARIDAGGALGEAARQAEAAGAKANGAFGLVIGALGADRMIAGGGASDCQAQLAIARGGQAGPLPSAEAAPAERPKLPKPADLLRQFLRQGGVSP